VKPGLIYRRPAFYELLKRAQYGRFYKDHLEAVANEVPPGSSVVELCCGPGTLYTHYLRERTSSYIGLDMNEAFIIALRRQGVDARPMDLSNSQEPLPSADVAIIQGRLHNFLPDPTHIIDRMLAASRRLTVISEPIQGDWRLTMFARRPHLREQALDQMFETYRELVVKETLIAGGREKLFVLRAG
jgi:trans-aconitate methyltransferase